MNHEKNFNSASENLASTIPVYLYLFGRLVLVWFPRRNSDFTRNDKAEEISGKKGKVQGGSYKKNLFYTNRKIK